MLIVERNKMENLNKLSLNVLIHLRKLKEEWKSHSVDKIKFSNYT